MGNKMTDIKLTIYIAREGDAYVAQCVEYDICAQAADMDTLFNRMTGLIRAEMHESERRTGTPFGGIPAAPAFYADAAARVHNSVRSPEGLEYKIAA
jgi:hypothetical protein